MTFKPQPQLVRAVRSALEIFARHKPQIFKLVFDQSDAGNAFVSDWARALVGVTLEAIPEAAQQWVATKIEIASPAAFGIFARGIDAMHFRPVVAPSTGEHRTPSEWPSGVERSKNTARIDALTVRAHQALGNREAAGEVWALLWETATTDDERAAVRAGNVPDDFFDDAVQIMADRREYERRGGRVATGAGPLAASMSKNSWLADSTPPSVPKAQALASTEGR